tara:strand:- start:153 stop:1037 length:885 start_codon:yes stop_codon:yes gene_type:complete
MPLTHIEHPEDSILTGDLSAIEILYGRGNVSVKVDGAPAIVWGIDPNNDEFFVATKSAFNKKKVKRCYTIEQIYQYYNQETHESLIEVLVACFKHLPRTKGVYQGDFIGLGGSDSYKPNTITYEFESVVVEDIIIAPHTCYSGKDFPTMKSYPLDRDLVSTSSCKFVQPFVDRVHQEISLPNINTDRIPFLSDKEATQAKMSINALIRSGQEVDESTLIDILGSPQLTNLYLFVQECKYDLMETFIVYDSPVAFIDDDRIAGEGFVMTSDTGMTIKLVDRPRFSYANMTQGRFN